LQALFIIMIKKLHDVKIANTPPIATISKNKQH